MWSMLYNEDSPFSFDSSSGAIAGVEIYRPRSSVLYIFSSAGHQREKGGNGRIARKYSVENCESDT